MNDLCEKLEKMELKEFVKWLDTATQQNVEDAKKCLKLIGEKKRKLQFKPSINDKDKRFPKPIPSSSIFPDNSK